MGVVVIVIVVVVVPLGTEELETTMPRPEVIMPRPEVTMPRPETERSDMSLSTGSFNG